jgi:hypothetical protein
MSMPPSPSEARRMPPLPSVELALQQATEFFAAELAHPGDARPQWTKLEWSMARAAAVLHGITPLLAGVLRWRGPREWQQFLSQQRIHTAVRHQRIVAQLARIDEHARRIDLAIVALKGAALHQLGVYSSGERPMADLDLLVAQADAERATQLLQGLGYLEVFSNWKHRAFEPAHHAVAVEQHDAAGLGEHAERPIKIDLHTRIAERLPLSIADVSALIHPAQPHPGLNRYPSLAVLFAHLLLHAAGNMVLRGLRLIQLHDLALLAARMQAEDWAQLLALEDQTLWWAVPPLELLARYYPQAVPGEVLAAVRPQCPRRLRELSRRQRLSQVSLTNLRVEAFPGISWSGSTSEKLSYMRDRILPSRELLAMRATQRAETWATANAWPQLSQGRRIWRWLVSRPLRPLSMHVVYAALFSA